MQAADDRTQIANYKLSDCFVHVKQQLKSEEQNSYCPPLKTAARVIMPQSGGRPPMRGRGLKHSI